MESVFSSAALNVDKIEELSMHAVDKYVEWHNDKYQKEPERLISSQRAFLVKMGIRLWFQFYRTRYMDKPEGQKVLSLLKDFILNRHAVLNLLRSDEPPEVISQRITAQIDATREGFRHYDKPLPLAPQLSVPESNNDLRVVSEKFALVSDQGLSGSFNGAVDADETVAINITLKNYSTKNYRSTSARLTTEDQYVTVEDAKVIYCERDESTGETRTFPPGMEITPSKNYTFSILSDCPDGYKVKFTLQIGDSDHGRSSVDFFLRFTTLGQLHLELQR